MYPSTGPRPGRLKWSHNPFNIHTLAGARPPPIFKRFLQRSSFCVWPGLQLDLITLTNKVQPQPLRATSFESAQHEYSFALVVPVLLPLLTSACFDLFSGPPSSCRLPSHTFWPKLTLVPLVPGLLHPGPSSRPLESSLLQSRTISSCLYGHAFIPTTLFSSTRRTDTLCDRAWAGPERLLACL